jgi:hypothetical protein
MGNIVLHPDGESLEDALEILNGKIYYVHLKNILQLRGEGFAAVGLAEGCIDTRKFLRMLKEQGYRHPICIEAPRLGDRDYFAAGDLAYTRSLLESLDWKKQSGRDTVTTASTVADVVVLPSGCSNSSGTTVHMSYQRFPAPTGSAVGVQPYIYSAKA